MNNHTDTHSLLYTVIFTLTFKLGHRPNCVDQAHGSAGSFSATGTIGSLEYENLRSGQGCSDGPL